MRCISGAHEQVYSTVIDILIYLANTATRKLTGGYNADARIRQLVVEHSAEPPSVMHDVFNQGR